MLCVGDIKTTPFTKECLIKSIHKNVHIQVPGVPSGVRKRSGEEEEGVRATAGMSPRDGAVWVTAS